MIKQALRNFLRWNVVLPLRDDASELIFQNIFAQQCANFGVANDFYPVSGAANYSLMYLLFRILNENRVDTIVELGSGQTTLLIDRIRPQESSHVCYEDDAAWHARLAPKLARCDYRLRPLERREFESRSFDAYAGMRPEDFDLLLVDGPHGTPSFSRFACVDLIAANRATDFVIVFDDAERPGERETIDYVLALFRRKAIRVATAEVRGRKHQFTIAAGRFVQYY